MARDFLRFVNRPASLVGALRRITVGGLLAAAGLTGSHSSAAPAVSRTNITPAIQGTTIVDRSRKRPALLLRLPNSSFLGEPQHRSHRSHSSHRSGSSGGSVAPAPAPRKAEPAPAPPANRLVGEPTAGTPTASTPGALGAMGTSLLTVSGAVEAIDRQARTITVRTLGSPAARVFSYRDDSKLETVTGSSIRFDEFSEMSGGQIPIAKDDKVRVAWRNSADGKTQILTSVTKTP